MKITITNSKAKYRVLTLSIPVLLSSLFAEEESGDIKKESITVTNEASDDSRSASLTCLVKVIDFIREKHQNLPLKVIVHVLGN